MTDCEPSNMPPISHSQKCLYPYTVYPHNQSKITIHYKQEGTQEVVRHSMQTEANEMLNVVKLASMGYDALGEMEAFDFPQTVTKVNQLNRGGTG